jgi:ariadne-1
MGTHHVWQCNVFVPKEEVAEDDETRARNEFERYLHYYERYTLHDRAQKFAQKQLRRLGKQELDSSPGCQRKSKVTGKDIAAADPQDNTSSPKKKEVDARLLPLLKDANQRLVECRRVLKFSYVFAYYHFLPTRSDTTAAATIMSDELKRQKECYEQHQGILEGLTEGLSKLTESSHDTMCLQDVANRTRVIGQFIKNVLEFVADGMAIDG